MKKSFVVCALLLVVLTSGAIAHEITFEIVQKHPAVSVRMSYSKAEPLVNAAVRIFAPGDAEKTYQECRTDMNGYVAFVPGAAGTWTVAVDDGHGHANKREIDVAEGFFTGLAGDESESGAAADGLPMTYKTLFGLVLIFGITGILYGLKARKSS